MDVQRIERAIEALARNQHGAFHRRQVLELGASPRLIQRRRERGEWLTLDRAIYALNSHPYSWMRQASAAQLVHPGAALSHRAAAAVHGIPGYRPGHLEVVVPVGWRVTSKLATVHTRDAIAAVRREGLRVTALADTVVDLAGVESASVLERVVDEVLVSGGADPAALRRALDSATPRHPRGAARLGSVLLERADGYVPPTSELEAMLYRLLDHPRLPGYERQAAFPWWPSAPQRVDALIPAWRRIVEADGRRWHTRRADFERDRARDHLAPRHGYEVTRFTYAQLRRDKRYALEVLLDTGAHAA